MKTRFTTLDIIACLKELRETLIGMRVNQVYDVDSKTYLLKLGKQDEKVTLLMESGVRIHTTEFEWPKNPAPSGFTMKLRKHLKNKRLESIQQLGVDRIIDLQFGINEATYHLILELYDRGNIVLADVNYCILNILRPRAAGSEDVKFVVREKYPVELAKSNFPVLTEARILEIFQSSKKNDNMKKCLNPHVLYGPSIIDHVLVKEGFPLNCQFGKDVIIERDLQKLCNAMNNAHVILSEASEKQCKGYIITKVQKISLPGEKIEKESETFEEFHPYLFEQHEGKTYKELECFNKAVDTFFSSLEGQKIEQKMVQKEKEALKKLENIKKDHEKRMNMLQENQQADSYKAQLIEMNLDIVDKAILIIRSAIANQIGWSDIWNLVTEAQDADDEVAKTIRKLKLDSNHFTMLLHNPYVRDSDEANEKESSTREPQLVDIDLDLTAYGNARKYYDFKKHAAKKEQKTVQSSGKVYKNAEKKTRLALKEVALTSSIIKARKTFWFEKFLWFISSENYLVIAGRDSQQNELIVKRYMKPGDIYVHADLHGASSVVVKNPEGGPIPPKTQNEAGTMAICYSAAWEAKVVTSAWWVYHHQVSKTAPSGEYLTSGSFMIRGKKNYMPPAQLVLGFGFLFKLDEDSLERHANERRIFGNDVEDNDKASTDVDGEEEEVGIEMTDSEDENPVPEDPKVEDEDNSKNNEVQNNRIVFPDTEVKTAKWESNSHQKEMESSDAPVYLGDDTPVILHALPPRVKQGKAKSKEKSKVVQIEPVVDDLPSAQQLSPKRGQRSKLRKIKDKYKDQDEEERRLRMEILASAGGVIQKDSKGKKGKKFKEQEKKQPRTSKPSETKYMLEPTTVPEIKNEECNETRQDMIESPIIGESTEEKPQKDDVSDEDEDEQNDNSTNEDERVINSLTGLPVLEDTLMFAVPVCAPYSAMLNYKYKVKIMPGTARRGKASKTALATFSRDKLATNREKDLLKCVKDQDISRNFPGKVKLSIPNAGKIKK